VDCTVSGDRSSCPAGDVRGDVWRHRVILLLLWVVDPQLMCPFICSSTLLSHLVEGGQGSGLRG